MSILAVIMTNIYQQIEQEVQTRKSLLLDLSHRIHAHPELRFEEHQAAEWLCETLTEQGFEVQKGFGTLETAFKASYGPHKAGKPTVAMLCEYDALEGLGHACGHNVIATMGLGAGLALAPLMSELDGNLVVIGTPGEEGGGGKAILIEDGAFKDVDAALMIHPMNENRSSCSLLARVAWEVKYSGVPAHAAASPHLGVNALDAVRLSFNGMDALRQQVTSDVRMHAVINHGGDVANIIPHEASLKVYIRAATRDYLYESVVPRMRAVYEGAAMMTGTTVEFVEIAKPYEDMIINQPLASSFAKHAERLGRKLADDEEPVGFGSSDIGNVSHIVPSLQGLLQIDAVALPHTHEFEAAAKSPQGDKAVLDGATILASVAADVFNNPSLLKS